MSAAPLDAASPATSVGLLAGKVAAITGGLTGIGRAIALEFLRQGANVVVNYLASSTNTTSFSDSLLSSLEACRPQNGTQLITLPGDVTDPSAMVELVSLAATRFGRLDIFVSNAGVCQFAEFLDISQDLWKMHTNVNLDGAFYAVQAAARQMASQDPKGGSIIAISSISALVGGGQQAAYTPTKAGVLSLMQSAAVALGKYGIRCNALLPGTIRTSMNEEDLSDKKKREYMETRTCLGRVGRPEDLAGPAVFLASELSGYVTGAQLLVDGGLFVNLQ